MTEFLGSDKKPKNILITLLIFISCIILSIYTLINLFDFLTGKTCECESSNLLSPTPFFIIQGVSQSMDCSNACALHDGKETNLSNIRNLFEWKNK